MTKLDYVLVWGAIAAIIALSAWAAKDWPAPVFFVGMGAVFGFVGGYLALGRAERTRKK